MHNNIIELDLLKAKPTILETFMWYFGIETASTLNKIVKNGRLSLLPRIGH